MSGSKSGSESGSESGSVFKTFCLAPKSDVKAPNYQSVREKYLSTGDVKCLDELNTTWKCNRLNNVEFRSVNGPNTSTVDPRCGNVGYFKNCLVKQLGEKWSDRVLNPKDDLSDILTVKRLGVPGKQGTTIQIKCEGKYYAVKVAAKGTCGGSGFEQTLEEKFVEEQDQGKCDNGNGFLHQARIQQLASEYNVTVPVEAVYCGGAREASFMVMEPLDMRLSDKYDSGDTLSSKHQKQLWELFKTLDEEVGILHNDYNCLNIMLDFEENVKLIDFDQSVIIDGARLVKSGPYPNIYTSLPKLNCFGNLYKISPGHKLLVNFVKLFGASLKQKSIGNVTKFTDVNFWTPKYNAGKGIIYTETSRKKYENEVMNAITCRLVPYDDLGISWDDNYQISSGTHSTPLSLGTYYAMARYLYMQTPKNYVGNVEYIDLSIARRMRRRLLNFKFYGTKFGEVDKFKNCLIEKLGPKWSDRVLDINDKLLGVAKRLGVPGKEGTTIQITCNGKDYAVKVAAKGTYCGKGRGQSVEEKKEKDQGDGFLHQAILQQLASEWGVTVPVEAVHCGGEDEVSFIVMLPLKTRLVDYYKRGDTLLLKHQKQLWELFKTLDEEVGILHNDYNCLNIMLDTEENVKLIDFDQSVIIDGARLVKSGPYPNLLIIQRLFVLMQHGIFPGQPLLENYHKLFGNELDPGIDPNNIQRFKNINTAPQRNAGTGNSVNCARHSERSILRARLIPYDSLDINWNQKNTERLRDLMFLFRKRADDAFAQNMETRQISVKILRDYDKVMENIPVKSTKKDGIDTLEIGKYFKVKNKEPWKYYLKTSKTASVNLKSYNGQDKKNKLKEAEITTNVSRLKKDGDDDPKLEVNEYFKVKNGDEFKYYKKTNKNSAIIRNLEDILADNLEDILADVNPLLNVVEENKYTLANFIAVLKRILNIN